MAFQRVIEDATASGRPFIAYQHNRGHVLMYLSVPFQRGRGAAEKTIIKPTPKGIISRAERDIKRLRDNHRLQRVVRYDGTNLTDENYGG